MLNTIYYNTLWKKSSRDLWEHKGRSLLVILSIAISTFTLGVILNSYSILSREMALDFLNANPTAISFSINKFESNLLSTIQTQPQVNKVEARRFIKGEIKTSNGEWLPLQLYVIRDYSDIRLDVLEKNKGQWPPLKNQILIEQQALSVLGSNIDDSINIKTRSGITAKLNIVGTAHDVVLPQAEWENIVYGYISADTLTNMGGEMFFNQLKVSLHEVGLTQQQMMPYSLKLKHWLEEQGYNITGVHVAKPGEPVHANITDGMFLIQKVFAILCCLLSAILVFNLISAILSAQLSQIGVMKALGASTAQIKGIYYRGIIILGLMGLTLSMPLSYLAANKYADKIAIMINFDIQSYSVPVWVFIIQITLGVGLPVFISTLPIRRASNISIRETFIEYGWQSVDFGNNLLERGLLKIKGLNQPIQLALRNCLRQKFRFALTVCVLMFAAALLMATFNVANTMTKVVEDERSSHRWGISIILDQRYFAKTISTKLNHIKSINQIEYFNRLSAAIIVEKNKGKDSVFKVNLTELSADSTMLNFPIIEGRWLSKNENEIVVSQLVINKLPHLKIGMPLTIEVKGKSIEKTLVGVVKVLGRPKVYTHSVLPEHLNRIQPNKNTNINNNASKQVNNRFNGVFVIAKQQDKENLNQLKNTLRNVADKKGLYVSSIRTVWEGLKVIEDHFDIIFSLMMLLTVIIVFIASNGIMLTMTTNIVERTKEIGILKAIGGTNVQLAKMILCESCVIAILAWVIACVVTLPISYCVTYWLGILLIKTPLPIALNGNVFLYALPLMICITALVSIIPMRQVVKLSVREALLYE